MHTHVFTQLGLVGNGASEFSQPIAMNGANAAQVESVVFVNVGVAATVTFTLQESDDLENWTTKATLSNPPTDLGYYLQDKTTGISTAYIRLKAALTGTSPRVVFSAGINIAAL
jgi:hypothetical protein